MVSVVTLEHPGGTDSFYDKVEIWFQFNSFTLTDFKKYILYIFINMKKEKEKIKVYALVLPVWVRVCVLRWSDLENFLWHVSHSKGLTPKHM